MGYRQTQATYRVICILFMWACVLPSVVCHADADALRVAVVVRRPDDDLLLLSLRIGTRNLCDDLDTYTDTRGVFLPLGRLGEQLELPLTVLPEQKKAVGYLLQHQSRFLLDLQKGEVTVGNRTQRFNAQLVELHDDDIYVESQLLAQWLAITLEVNKSAATLSAKSKIPFPVESRLEREQRAALLKQWGSSSAPTYPRINQPYQLWSSPHLSQSVTFNADSETSSTQLAQYSLTANAELLYMDTNLLMFGSKDRTPTMRGTMSRTDCDGKLLGLMQANEFAVGDIYLPSLPLVSSSQACLGGFISRYPNQRSGQFDTRDFEGSLAPGWDVELYRGNMLLDFQSINEDGRYAFRNVPLFFGLNEFRLVFYGPRGERREESYRYNIDSSIIQPGKFYYQLSAGNPEDRGTSVVYQSDFGLRQNLSLSAGYVANEVGETPHQYTSLGMRGFWGGIFSYANTAVDLSGGSASEFGLRTQLKSVYTTLTYQHVGRDFTSDVFSGGENGTASRVKLQLDGIPLPRRLGLNPMGIVLTQERSWSGETSTAISHRLSARYGNWWVTNYLDWQNVRNQTTTEKSAGGQLMLSRYFKGFSLRGGVQYDLLPTYGFSGANLSCDLPIFHEYRLGLGVNHTFDRGDTDFSVSITRLFDTVSLANTAAYSGQGHFTSGTTLSTNLFQDPFSGNWHVDSHANVDQGNVAVRVFLDTNSNGKLDTNEKRLNGVGLRVNGYRSRDAKTDKNGTVVLTGLTCHQPANISLDVETLEDTLYQPTREGFSVVPRPGSAFTIDYPVIVTSEITGTVYIQRENGPQGARGIAVELVNKTGDVVQTARSAYDGYYTFTKVPTGSYTLRINADQLKRGQFSMESRTIETPPDGDYLDGIDLTLVRVSE